MAVLWDATMLSLLLHQTARIPVTPGTKTPISFARERIELLLSDLAKQKETILIPAPALTEFLCLVEEAGPGYVHTINKKSSFEVAPFDEKAAIEAADMMRQFKKEDGNKSGPGEGLWQKVKVDQQIVAIAKAEVVDRLYTADRGMVNMAKRVKVPVTALWELQAPESKTPLLDTVQEEPASVPADVQISIEPEPLVSQSPVDVKAKGSLPALDLPATPLVDPKQQQQDSSPAALPPPPPKK